MADDTDDLPGSGTAPRGSALTGDGKVLRNGVVVLTIVFAVAAAILFAVFIRSLSDVFPHDNVERSHVAASGSDRAPSGAAGLHSAGSTGNALLQSGSITADDYPPAARRAGEEGRVVMDFTVSRDGSVKDCHIAQSSGSTTLDEASCSLLTKRFRYSPATDSSGKPVAQNKTQAISWKLQN